MSVITLFYGQCGNQISESLYSNIYNDTCNSKQDVDYYNQSLNKWFHVSKSNKWEPRSILIDTECKTVPPKNNPRYNFKNVVSKSCGGAANNWAFGYYEQSKHFLNDVLGCVKRELEKSGLPKSFLNVMSSSGGTGAGVGSFIIENLKDKFPKIPIINVLVLPYTNGELVTQSYNSVLALTKIYPISDAIILFENDRLHYNCKNSLNIKDVDFSDINDLIGRQLLSVYQPLETTDDVQTPDLLTKLCQDDFKILQIRLAPLSKLENASNWSSLLTSISRQSRFDFQQRNEKIINLKAKTLSEALICRGAYKPEEKDWKPFKDLNKCKTVQVYHHKRRIFDLENCLAVVSNSNNSFIPINSFVQDAQNLYKYGAYVHHYNKYGVDESHFSCSFEAVEKFLEDYKNL